MSFFWLIKTKHYNNSYRSYKKIQTDSPFIKSLYFWLRTMYDTKLRIRVEETSFPYYEGVSFTKVLRMKVAGLEKNLTMNTPNSNYHNFHLNWRIFIFGWFARNYFNNCFKPLEENGHISKNIFLKKGKSYNEAKQNTNFVWIISRTSFL